MFNDYSWMNSGLCPKCDVELKSRLVSSLTKLYDICEYGHEFNEKELRKLGLINV